MNRAPATLSYDQVKSLLIPRAADTHKGDYGHTLVVGGASGMGGACLMAAEAAARCGSGLTSVATHPDHAGYFLLRRPELMVAAAATPDVINVLGARATTLVLGPGLGHGAWSAALHHAALALGTTRNLPLVLDADGLNLLNGTPPDQPETSKWILTPHAGEAARLLGRTREQIEQDRESAARALQTRYGGVAILKGAGTLVCYQAAGEQHVERCVHGNPGMATGGMGDVLSGVLGALLAQGLSLAEAARLGVCLHSNAADLAARTEGQRGLLATDLFPYLRPLLNP